MTAWANDDCYDCIFEQQLRNLANSGDVAIAISGSGKSANVVKGIEYAKEVKMKTIAFTGYDGGKIASLVDLNFHVPSFNMGLVEAAHAVIFHYIIDELKIRFANMQNIKQKRA